MILWSYDNSKSGLQEEAQVQAVAGEWIGSVN